MDTVPEVPKCFGIFPPKVATYFISLFGMGSGGVGLAGIILYGLVEDSALAHFFTDRQVDEQVKKFVLMTLGLSSLLLCIGNGLLFLGILFKQDRALLIGAWVLFAMCVLIITGAVGTPCACFFFPNSCVVKKLSIGLYTFGYIFITIFLWIWLYFMVVVFNYINGAI